MSKAIAPYGAKSPSVQDLLRFLFDGLEVRVADRDGNPWFVAKDVCSILGLKDARLSRLAAADRSPIRIPDRLGREQPTTVISLAGVFALVLTSRVAGAERFKTWLTSEVLPQIYKTGSYALVPDDRDARIATLEGEVTRLTTELSSTRALLPPPPPPPLRWGVPVEQIMARHLHFAARGVYGHHAKLDAGTKRPHPSRVWLPDIAIHGTCVHPGPGAYAWASHGWTFVAISRDIFAALLVDDPEARELVDRIVRYYDHHRDVLTWLERERRAADPLQVTQAVLDEAYLRVEPPSAAAMAA